MARQPSERPLVLSVLDRLLDFDPGNSREAPLPPHQVLRQMKQSVQRDLENLLNTRVRHLILDPGYTELKQSLVSYGLPDFTTMNLETGDDRQAFCHLVHSVITRFEPRLANVQVVPVDQEEPLDRIFRFRIDALLQVEPAPEPVVFDSRVEPATGDVKVGRGSS